MKRRVQKVYKRLPPHTYEAHPVANAGEASKPLIIGIIAIVAVIALSLLLLFSDQIVGKAFFTGEMNSAGAEVVPSKVYENQPFSLKVKANTGGKETNVVGFELDLAPGMTCDNVQSIQNLLGWDVESKSMCDAAKNKIIFEYATFGAGKSGTFDVAQIVIVPGFAQGDFQFDLGPFQAFDSNNMNIITNVLDPIVQVKKAVCGDGDKAPSEQCDDGNVVNGDGCSSTCMTEQVQPQQVCTANQWLCEGTTAKKQCKADGTGYNTKVDCASGETCSNGACVMQPQQVQLQCANVPSGLVSKWSGDESTKDDLGNSADGSLKGGATFAPGKVVLAFSLDGKDDYVEIPDAPSQAPATAMTVSAWINLKSRLDMNNMEILNGAIACKNDISKPEASWCFMLNNNKLRFFWWDQVSLGATGFVETVNTVAASGQWYHVAAIYDSAAKSAKLYVNGQEVQSTLNPGSAFNPIYDSTVPLILGNNLNSGNIYQFFNGLIDEVALWNRALTSVEVKSIYDAGSMGMCKCGNGLKEGAEQCDDKNIVNGDGCSSACMVESDFTCAGEPSICQKQMQQVCTANQWLCEGTTAKKQCKADGSGYNTKVDCASGETCSNGACVVQPQQVCTANQWLCEGTTAKKQCKADGSGYNAQVNCASGETCSNGACVMQPQQVCTANQWACEGTTAKKQCKADGSGYNTKVDCASGETCSNGVCAAVQLQPVSVIGKKITLTDVAAANNVFATKVTATETFTNEVTVYTILYNKDGKVLSIKSEKLEAGLAKDVTYTASVNYPEANVKKKSVIVYDVKQNPSVFGQLEMQKS